MISSCDTDIGWELNSNGMASLKNREGLEEQRMWQEAEKILEVEAREAEYRVRREVEEAKREAEDKEAELKRAKVTWKY